VRDEKISPQLIERWLDVSPEEFSTRFARVGSNDRLTWMDWSLWGLFGCSMVANTIR